MRILRSDIKIKVCLGWAAKITRYYGTKYYIIPTRNLILNRKLESQTIA
ncbi:hypothetical protein BMETH_957_0 [methanotrophic bacterial endosymbiont of Bathymodiolus sp.]|nr:hypothetical protein BMETH_957_0 [methanotrophic bacterial endosymbiont of Bathymodiolus sp.]